VADELQRWVAKADVDGFNLSSVIRPGGVRDFVRLVSPELRRRGVLAEPAEGQSFRETVLSAGDRLTDNHYAARFRRRRSF